MQKPTKPSASWREKVEPIECKADVIADVIADKICEHIVYPPHVHPSIVTFPKKNDSVISLFRFLKTYPITGWRVGYTYGSIDIIKKWV